MFFYYNLKKYEKQEKTGQLMPSYFIRNHNQKSKNKEV